MVDRKSIIKIGAAALGISAAIITASSPARADVAYVDSAHAGDVARDTVSHTEGQSAVIEALLARSAVTRSRLPIIFSDNLGPKVATWARTYGAGKFLVTPVSISGEMMGVALFDPSSKGQEPYHRISAAFTESNGQYIAGMRTSLSEYRMHGVSSAPIIEKLDAEQLFAVTQFASSVQDNQPLSNESQEPKNQEQNKHRSPQERAERAIGADVIRAVENVYYGQNPHQAGKNVINNTLNNVLNSAVRGIQR